MSLVARCINARFASNLAKFSPILSQRSQFHMTSPAKSTQYYPINDDMFQLTDEQKQVKFKLKL